LQRQRVVEYNGAAGRLMFVRKELISNRPPPVQRSADTFTNFSLGQWVALFVLDIAPKAVICWYQPYLSIVFLATLPLLFFPVLLIPVTYLVSFFRLKTIWVAVLIPLITNTVLVGVFTFYRVQEHAAHRRDFCFRTPGAENCDIWANGIPWSIVLETATSPLTLVIFDVIVFLAVFIYSRLRAHLKLSQRAA